jgi:hypothetical protein
MQSITLQPNAIERGYYSVEYFNGDRSQLKVIGSDKSDLIEALAFWRVSPADIDAIYAEILQHFLKSELPFSFAVAETKHTATHVDTDGMRVIRERQLTGPWRNGWIQFRFAGAKRSNLLPESEFNSRFAPIGKAESPELCDGCYKSPCVCLPDNSPCDPV